MLHAPHIVLHRRVLHRSGAGRRRALVPVSDAARSLTNCCPQKQFLVERPSAFCHRSNPVSNATTSMAGATEHQATHKKQEINSCPVVERNNEPGVDDGAMGDGATKKAEPGLRGRDRHQRSGCHGRWRHTTQAGHNVESGP